jgi:hypothetical protein
MITTRKERGSACSAFVCSFIFCLCVYVCSVYVCMCVCVCVCVCLHMHVGERTPCSWMRSRKHLYKVLWRFCCLWTSYMQTRLHAHVPTRQAMCVEN